MPGKALRDRSDPEIACLWNLRAQLDEHLKTLTTLTAPELKRELVAMGTMGSDPYCGFR
jgi:hypothetical protein